MQEKERWTWIRSHFSRLVMEAGNIRGCSGASRDEGASRTGSRRKSPPPHLLREIIPPSPLHGERHRGTILRFQNDQKGVPSCAARSPRKAADLPASAGRARATGAGPLRSVTLKRGRKCPCVQPGGPHQPPSLARCFHSHPNINYLRHLQPLNSPYGFVAPGAAAAPTRRRADANYPRVAPEK